MSYGYLNYHSPFPPFYTGFKRSTFNKRIVSGKRFKAIPSVVYAVGATKDFEVFLAILCFITLSNSV